MKKRGYSLVELIIVILLLGTLSALALPRFFDRPTFDNAFTRSQFESLLSWTRNRTLTAACAHEVRLSINGWQVLRDRDCSTQLAEASCSSGATLDFASPVRDGSGVLLSGDAPSTSELRRLLFLPDGTLRVLTTAATVAGCTALPTQSETTAAIALLPEGLLNWDEATAYVALP